MASFAKLDENNNVLEVIVINTEDCLDDDGNECEETGRKFCEKMTGYSKWKKTSRNTRLGIHYDPFTFEPSEDQSKSYRLNYAGANMVYNEELDAFVEKRPVDHRGVICNSWILNASIGIYEPPVERTKDGLPKTWDETTRSWLYL